MEVLNVGIPFESKMQYVHPCVYIYQVHALCIIWSIQIILFSYSYKVDEKVCLLKYTEGAEY